MGIVKLSLVTHACVRADRSGKGKVHENTWDLVKIERSATWIMKVYAVQVR